MFGGRIFAKVLESNLKGFQMNTLRILAAVAVIGFVFAVGVQAKEMNMEKQVTVKGKVEATKDASGTVTAVKIKTWGKTYNVTLDAKGMELAGMEGKKVEATGMTMKKDKKHWLTVESYQEKTKKKM